MDPAILVSFVHPTVQIKLKNTLTIQPNKNISQNRLCWYVCNQLEIALSTS